MRANIKTQIKITTHQSQPICQTRRGGIFQKGKIIIAWRRPLAMLSDQLLIKNNRNGHDDQHVKQTGKTASEKISGTSHLSFIVPLLYQWRARVEALIILITLKDRSYLVA
uniref:Uncharacterized protein n=1 Tax=uncultured alpha proteobacterium HF0070_05I22 TaxID=710803 RepID=E0XX75_9PROT|nr:hypothetical protein [uncultured alpha proteobacterium HF0070_05I22]